jgi:adenylate cyclase
MITVGDWLFEPAGRRLIAGQDERRLSPKAAGVLAALAERPGQVWSRDALLERVWAGVTVCEEVLTHAVAELRKALADDFRDPHYVETVHKSGYRLKCRAEGTSLDAGRPSAGLQAYVTYLEACELFERGGTRNTSDAAARFAAALEEDPSFALAHVGLAKSLAFLGVYYSPGLADLEKARDHAQAALRIAPRLGEAHAVDGFIWAIGGHFDRALSAFRIAVRLKPESSEVHYLIGRACFAELNVGLAGPMLERAAVLRNDEYHSLMLAGKARQMIGDGQRACEDFAVAEARIRQRLEACPEDYRALCDLTRCLVQLGRWPEAQALLERIGDHKDPMNYHVACTYARAGEPERALDILADVVDHGWRHGAWLARDPDFDGLRSDRRFTRIAASIDRHGGRIDAG